MSVLHLFYYVIFSVNILTAIAIIFLERKNVAVTWAWLMVLLFIPVGGFILYLLLGKNLNGRKIYRLKKSQRAVVDALVDFQKRNLQQELVDFHDPLMANYQDMIYMNLISSYAVYTQDNAVAVFTDGHSKFMSLLQDIESAEHHVHLQYYIIRDDHLGQRLLHVLTAKARQGVRVRILYDAFGCTGLQTSWFRHLREAGGEVAAFFPSTIPYVSLRMNHRNHRKMAIIDGRVGYIGGFNIGDEYLGLDKRFGAWRDTHLRVQGSAVLEMQALFLMDWNFAARAAMPIDEGYFPIETHGGNVGLQIVASGPNSTAEQIRNAYIKMIYAGKQSVYIQTPYFIPDESLLTALKTAALSGLDVRVMLPLKPDHRLVYLASKFYFAELLAIGIKFYLYEAGFLHAKTVVVDGKIASVGTANIDIRSFKLNFEVNALIYDTMTASKLMETFEHDLQACTELTLDAYRRRPRPVKIAESCARLLSPIL